MKLFVVACLIAVAAARPQVEQRERAAETLRFENINDGLDGNFQYAFETDNEINVEAVGVPGVEGQSNINGNFRFPLGDGSYMEVTYEADERGYRPSFRVVRN